MTIFGNRLLPVVATFAVAWNGAGGLLCSELEGIGEEEFGRNKISNWLN
jgi:hypothetical protein